MPKTNIQMRQTIAKAITINPNKFQTPGLPSVQPYRGVSNEIAQGSPQCTSGSTTNQAKKPKTIAIQRERMIFLDGLASEISGINAVFISKKRHYYQSVRNFHYKVIL